MVFNKSCKLDRSIILVGLFFWVVFFVVLIVFILVVVCFRGVFKTFFAKSDA